MLYYSKFLFCYGEKETKFFRVLQNYLALICGTVAVSGYRFWCPMSINIRQIIATFSLVMSQLLE